MSHVRIETGFDASEERAGNDRAVVGQLLIADASGDEDDVSNDTNGVDNGRCKNFVAVAKFDGSNGRLEYFSKDDAQSGKTKCLRIQIFKGQSDWVMVRLIQIETKPQK